LPARILIRDVMRPAACVKRNTTLREVAQTMVKHDMEVVAIVDGSSGVIGVITAADLTVSDLTLSLAGVAKPRLRGLWFAPADMLEKVAIVGATQPVASAMRTWCVTVAPDEDASTVAQHLMKQSAREALVVENRRPVGVVCCRDLVKVIAGCGERDFSGLRAC